MHYILPDLAKMGSSPSLSSDAGQRNKLQRASPSSSESSSRRSEHGGGRYSPIAEAQTSFALGKKKGSTLNGAALSPVCYYGRSSVSMVLESETTSSSSEPRALIQCKASTCYMLSLYYDPGAQARGIIPEGELNPAPHANHQATCSFATNRALSHAITIVYPV